MIGKYNKEKLATISLMMGMFFLPFGYDALFKVILDWTHSYWTTDVVFYSLSAVFFMSYYYFSNTNPVKAVLNKINGHIKALKKFKMSIKS